MKAKKRAKKESVVAILAVTFMVSSNVFSQTPMSPVDTTAIDGNYHFSNSTMSEMPSPKTAFAVSTLATVLPVFAGIGIESSSNGDVGLALIGAGVFIGPSIGYFYGGSAGRGMAGIGVRTVTAGAFTFAAMQAGQSADNGEMLSGLEEALTVGLIGAGAVVIEMLYDIGKVEQHVKKQNAKFSAVNIGSTVIGSNNSPGAVITVTF